MSVRHQKTPDKLHTVQGLCPKLSQVDLRLQHVTGLKDPFLQSGQGYHWCAEPPELSRGDVTLFLPEGIKHAHQGRALAGEIVQVQQLKPAKTRRAQGSFNVGLVAQGLELA